jgi:hypothetical protein
MSMNWISIDTALPEHNQRVLAYIPGNKVFLPGKDLEFEIREVIVLRFLRDFYPEGSEKRAKHGPHFWQGEGNSNHFFHAVEAWMPIPIGPGQ